jgi:hypothetical protein
MENIMYSALKTLREKLSVAVVIIATSFLPCAAQVATAGPFTLQQTSIAGGGTTNSAAGQMNGGSTTGQPAAGRPISVQSFTLFPGFWTPNDLVPTAAGVSISGMVLTPTGTPIVGARVFLAEQNGGRRAALSNPFGYYQFDDVEAGQLYQLNATHRFYQFQTVLVRVVDQVTDLNLVSDQ